MNYTESYLKDLTNIQNVIANLDKLKNKNILITGAGGLICSAIVDFLIQLNDTKEMNINIYLAARNYDKLERRFKSRMNRTDVHFCQYDACEPVLFAEKIDYLIHGASNAHPAVYVSQPVETMLANFIGMKNILEYAHKSNSTRVLYISSSEVYGKKDDGLPYFEDDYEYLDILNLRACYPSSKRAAETLCIAYQNEYNVDTVIVRPGHVYGPTMTETDTRAASQFAKDVINNKEIIMKSMGTQLRSYCYVLDCVSAIITVLLNGEKGEAYNISNAQSVVTIRDLAECFCKYGNQQLKFELPTESERAGYNLMDNSSLDSSKIENLGWRGLFDLQSGVKATLEELKG